MNGTDLDHFKEQLKALEQELEADLAGSTAAEESIAPDNAIGRLTRMEAIQSQAMDSAGRRRQEQRLQRVRRALVRIDRGGYGICTRCGVNIPRRRLEIIPESGLCVTCAAKAR